MTPEHLSSRRSRARVALVAIAVGGAMALGACAPTPASDPTPTPLFASEEEAFAAAEATYRAYIDAANRERAGDRTADPQAFLRGEALEEAIDARRDLRERSVTLVGESAVHEVQGISAQLEGNGSVKSHLCLDVSDTSVLDSTGADITPSSRSPRILLAITFDPSRHSVPPLLISASEYVADAC
ncbi:hypothetical protein PFZ55_43900 [Streptomyces sp. MS2A]|nr:hypothetical protein [Streptomyces sp. MS2A]